MKHKNSLIKKIWFYLSIFSIVILGLLWLFQVIFLDSYYVYVKTKDIKKITNEIKDSYESNDVESLLDSLTMSKDVCIVLVEDSTEAYSSSGYNKSCFTINENRFLFEKYKDEFILSDSSEVQYTITDKTTESKFLISGVKLNDNKYLFITTSLKPIGSTKSILTSQLIIVTIIVLIVGLLISYFISKIISKPIIEINKNAKKMSRGEFGLDFKTDSKISEIIELSETLNLANKELSKTDEIRRELMANISHDLKTPLTMIKAYAEMVRDLTYNNKEKRNSNLNTIIEETDRLNLLVNDILDLSKVQSNDVKLTIEEFDLNELISNIIKRFDYLEDLDNYKFIYENNKKLLVKADYKSIEQVIYNLVSNAITYVGKDLVVKINVIEKAKSYIIEVIDYGKGVKEKELEFIFDKYYRVDKTHKRSTNGTGLGLSIVKSILIKHGFDYGVRSKVNKGTTFYFEINKNK